MNKQRLLIAVNSLLGLSVIIQVLTVLSFGFVRSEAFGEIHEINGYVIIGLVCVHIYLNWAWIRYNILKKR
jgi:hypothetical protein